jgi:hypothetical protein
MIVPVITDAVHVTVRRGWDKPSHRDSAPLACVVFLCAQIKAPEGAITKHLTQQEAGDARDALAKALYSGRHPAGPYICLTMVADPLERYGQ